MKKKRGRGYQVQRELRAVPCELSAPWAGLDGKGRAVLGDSNVAAGKFFFGVNRGPTPLASDFGSTSPPISGRAGHGNNASKVGHSPTINFFGGLPSCSRYDIFLKHCSQAPLFT